MIFILYFLLLIWLIPFCLFSLSKFLRRKRGKTTKYRNYCISSCVMTAISILLLAYGFLIGRFLSEVTYHSMESPEIPESFNNFRIVQISDLHLKAWPKNGKALQKIVDKINNLNADVIVFTGDLISIDPEEIEIFLPVLSRMRANECIISILGNHDYGSYHYDAGSNEQIKAAGKLINLEKKLGWDILINENRIIKKGNDSIAIIGTENTSCGKRRTFHRQIQRGDIVKASTGSEGLFRILLTHDPTHWSHKVIRETDIPLTLCGHTHCMQIRIAGISPAALFYPQYAGVYRNGNQFMYINIGLGGSVPFRIGAIPEITSIKLYSSPSVTFK